MRATYQHLEIRHAKLKTSDLLTFDLLGALPPDAVVVDLADVGLLGRGERQRVPRWHRETLGVLGGIFARHCGRVSSGSSAGELLRVWWFDSQIAGESELRSRSGTKSPGCNELCRASPPVGLGRGELAG